MTDLDALRAEVEKVLPLHYEHHPNGCNLSQTFGFCVAECPDRQARSVLALLQQKLEENLEPYLRSFGSFKCVSQRCRDGKHGGTGDHRCLNCDCVCHTCEADLTAAREALWNACPHEMKYGDDGEMQCGAVDFKRDAIDLLASHLMGAREGIARLRS